MVQRIGKFDGKKYILERFDSIDEFIKTIEERPISPQYSRDSTAKSVRSDHINDPRWSGAESYDEAKTAFVNGTKAKTEMSKAFCSDVDPHQRETHNAPCGCAPIVAHALMGVPDAMIDIRRKRIPKATRVIVNMSISCGTNAREITEAGKKIIAAIGKLESQGISTEIMCTADKEVEGVYSSCSIAIKNAGQAFNAARVSFSMSSPAFLRVFQFAHLSSQPDSPYSHGYGRAISYRLSGQALRDYYRAMYGNGIYISLAEVDRQGQYAIDQAIEAWRKGK